MTTEEVSGQRVRITEMIDDEIYGTCIRCGRKNPIVRLRHVPEAMMCVPCAERRCNGSQPSVPGFGIHDDPTCYGNLAGVFSSGSIMMKLGRNDPCHCGSGKKYKYCHYEEDRRAEAEALKKAAEERAGASGEPDESEEDSKGRSEKQKHRDGSRFLRESSRGGKTTAGAAPGGAPRTTRGSQRGG
ncbi:MAG: SEC-C metal-binding domain-containing protein [Alkalispirochaeta sp.]